MIVAEKQSKKSLKFYQSLADNFARCTRGNALVPPAITRFRLSHEEFVVYIILFNELCLRLPSVVCDVPYLDNGVNSLAQACELLPTTVELALRNIQAKGLIDYTDNPENLHICVYDLFSLAEQEG